LFDRQGTSGRLGRSIGLASPLKTRQPRRPSLDLAGRGVIAVGPSLVGVPTPATALSHASGGGPLFGVAAAAFKAGCA
jgi:hypothetical protein